MAVVVSDVVQALPDWKLKFIKMLVQHGDLKYGDITRLIKDFAKQHQVPESTVGYFYYKEYRTGKLPHLELVKKSFEEEPGKEPNNKNNPQPEKEAKASEVLKTLQEQKDDMPVELTSEEMARLVELDPAKFLVRDGNYKKGMMIEVKVLEIREYGVMMETTDGFHTRGMIHNSEITKTEFVSNAGKFFRFGDVVIAQILEFDEMRDRLKLTTRNLPMKPINYISAVNKATQPLSKPEETTMHPPINIVGDKLGALKDKIQTVTPAAPTTPAAPAAAARKELTPAAKTKEIPEHERQFVKAYLNGIVGAVTPEAEEMMIELVQKHGMFQFTLALTEAKAKFKPDLGVILMKEIDVKIGEGL